ncbi:unnamed protein product [Rangifer tarandus platyrhynchus]|uniref:Secreted protein n=1 Tax=Rangifer tarandus platyrhynchus TaxID=3082113 RepID=A0ABN8Y4P1_RANTA|nr:unnamed protein product [Rangifer tarandus platyrhynchus]
MLSTAWILGASSGLYNEASARGGEQPAGRRGDPAAAPSRRPTARERFTSGWKDRRPGWPGLCCAKVRPWPRSPAPDGAVAESGGRSGTPPPDASGPRWPRSRRRARTLAGTQTHTHPAHTRSRSPSVES